MSCETTATFYADFANEVEIYGYGQGRRQLVLNHAISNQNIIDSSQGPSMLVT